jgi:ParB-like chromosome segregation protein Spo0J
LPKRKGLDFIVEGVYSGCHGEHTEVTPTIATDKKKCAPLELVLTYDHSLQVRGGIDPAKVDRYRKIMKDNGEDGKVGTMDPITVFYETDDGPRWIADGFHRIDAALAEKAETIPTVYRQGTKSRALRFALGENGHHGAPMTNAEKRHAAEMAVLDADLGEMKDKDLARLVGCSQSLIADARRGETPEVKTEKSKKRADKKNVGTAASPASGKQDDESPAPREATARERTPKDVKPTKAAILKQIQSWIDLDQVDEAEVVELFNTAEYAYYFMGRPGQTVTLKVVGKNNRAQVETEVVVKEVSLSKVTFRYEGDGKLAVQEA